MEEATCCTIEDMDVDEEAISSSSLPIPPEDMEVEQEAANSSGEEILDMALSHVSQPAAASLPACACSVHAGNTVNNTLIALVHTVDALHLLLTQQPPLLRQP